jgi:hypothetical protein
MVYVEAPVCVSMLARASLRRLAVMTTVSTELAGSEPGAAAAAAASPVAELVALPAALLSPGDGAEPGSVAARAGDEVRAASTGKMAKASTAPAAPRYREQVMDVLHKN